MLAEEREPASALITRQEVSRLVPGGSGFAWGESGSSLVVARCQVSPFQPPKRSSQQERISPRRSSGIEPEKGAVGPSA